MASATGQIPRSADAAPVAAQVLDRLGASILAGAVVGLLVGGVGGRLAMLVLRLTSPDLQGILTDDGFEIGQFTLGGTVGLLAVGAAIGMLGAIAYRLVAPWLVGPAWFRRVTTALGAGVVVGSMLVHADGVDFNLLKPAWLAILLFVAIPALFGAVIGDALAYCDDPDAWPNQGRWRHRLLPVAALAFVPFVLVLLVPVAVIWFLAAWAREGPLAEWVLRQTATSVVVRAVWLGVALLGLMALLDDIQAIA